MASRLLALPARFHLRPPVIDLRQCVLPTSPFVLTLLISTACSLFSWTDCALGAPQPPQVGSSQGQTSDLETGKTAADPSVPFLVPPALSADESRRLRESLSSRKAQQEFTDTQYAMGGLTGLVSPLSRSPESALGFLTGYGWARAEKRYWQLTAQLVTGSTFAGRFDLQHVWLLQTSPLRPHLTSGLTMRLNPTDGLIAFLKYQSWGVRLGGGADYTLSPDFSVRVSTEVAAGFDWSEAVAGLHLLLTWSS